MNTLCGILAICACAVAAALAKTECELHRERELASDVTVKLVPRCDSEGAYEALQCFEGSEFCMCWRADGSHITAPTRYLETCTCHVHRDKALKLSETGIEGNFIPTCVQDGTYSRRQCSGSTGMCWGVDRNNNQQSKPTRQPITC